MKKVDLTPWTCSTLLLGYLVLFFGLDFGLMGFTVLKALFPGTSVITKAFGVIVIVGVPGALVSMLQWTMRWRRIRYDVSFWTFVSGPEPEDQQDKLAWVWGRRLRVCSVAAFGAIAVIVVAAVAAGHF